MRYFLLRNRRFAVDSADTTKNLNEDILNQASGTVKKLSTPEPQLLPDLNSAAWDTCNEGEYSCILAPNDRVPV